MSTAYRGPAQLDLNVTIARDIATHAELRNKIAFYLQTRTDLLLHRLGLPGNAAKICARQILDAYHAIQRAERLWLAAIGAGADDPF